MASPLRNIDGFVDDADPSQPRIVIQIDGGLELSDGERSLRDEMVKPFIEDLITAIRGFYDHRRLAGPFKRETDAAKLAAKLADMEVPMK